MMQWQEQMRDFFEHRHSIQLSSWDNQSHGAAQHLINTSQK